MSKTIGVEVIELQYVIPNSIVVSGTIDVSTNSAICLFINYCQTNNDDHMIQPARIRVEGRYDAVDYWLPVTSWEPDRTAPASAEVTGSAPVGSTSLSFADTPEFWSIGDYAFIRHQVDSIPLDLTKSEFVRMQSITSTTVELYDPTKISHTEATGESIYLYNRAQSWLGQLNVSALTSLRVMIDAASADKQFAIESSITYLDS